MNTENIAVDNLQVSGTTTITGNCIVNKVTQSNYKPGKIIEYICGVCDGSTFTTEKGDITFPNVTTGLLATFGYQDATGSVIDYTPPDGTTTVVYEYWFDISRLDDNTFQQQLHMTFYIDDVLQTGIGARTVGVQKLQQQIIFKIPIRITGVTSAADITVADWTSSKELKVQIRKRSVDLNLHRAYSVDGGTPNSLVRPTLSLMAIS